jgi:putative transposase
VSTVSRLFGYQRQTYYKRLHYQNNQLDKSQQVLESVLKERIRMPRLGTRKLHYRLSLQGIHYGRDRLFELLRSHRLLIKPRRSYTKTTYSKHWLTKYNNLIKDKTVIAPDQIWVSDITYIPTDAGYHYLSLITDKFSRKIVGYDLSDNLKTEGALRALQMALKRRTQNHNLIHHSDRGLQYCSYEYQQLLAKHNIKSSMTEKGDPYENALAERMNGILKTEFMLEDGFPNPHLAQLAIDEAVEIYNTQRPHLSLQMKTPDQVYKTKTSDEFSEVLT